MNDIIVGMADFKIARGPAKLVTLGLGSCIGIAIYDPVTKVGGLAHIMLPDSKASNKDVVVLNPAKFADTGINEMIKQLITRGATRSRMVAKLAGGAQMFNFKNTSNIMKIGENNYESVKKVLEQNKVRIISEDCGLNYGRTVTLDLSNGEYEIKAVGKPTKII